MATGRTVDRIAAARYRDDRAAGRRRGAQRPRHPRLHAGKRRGDALRLASAAIAIRRLALYDDAFGLTIPWFVTIAFAIWRGVVLAAAAIAFTGPRSGRRWLVPVLGALGCCGWPRSTSSIRRACDDPQPGPRSAGAELGLIYAQQMSVDATPSLVAGLARLPPDQAAGVSQRICQRRQIHTSIVNWSLAEHRGQEAGTRSVDPGGRASTPPAGGCLPSGSGSS